MCVYWGGFSLFIQFVSFDLKYNIIVNNLSYSHTVMRVCVEVLRPSQPSGVMSSAVSLPNHTFTGQA